jgi:hypothetical protein
MLYGRGQLSESIIFLLLGMTTSNNLGNDEYILSLKTVTWQKDSHSLFDYEFNKNVIQNTFEFPLTPKYVYIYRNNSSTSLSSQPPRCPSMSIAN